MSAVASAIVVSAGASLIGSSNAANAQENAANTASQTQQSMFNTQQQNLKPYLQAGDSALGQLQTDLPNLTRQFSASDFQEDPAYNFDLQQGEQAMQRSAAAKGMLNSTGTLQNLNNYAQNQASNEYQNAYNRFTTNQQQQYNMLAGIANMGNTANSTSAQIGMNTANNISSNQLGAGNAAAAGSMAASNSIGNIVNSGANSYTNSQLMNRIFPQNNTNSLGGLSPSQQVAQLPTIQQPSGYLGNLSD